MKKLVPPTGLLIFLWENNEIYLHFTLISQNTMHFILWKVLLEIHSMCLRQENKPLVLLVRWACAFWVPQVKVWVKLPSQLY